VSLEDYSLSNRGLNSGLVGTPEQIAERILGFERAGVDLLLLQFSPQHNEMERFAEEVIPLSPRVQFVTVALKTSSINPRPPPQFGSPARSVLRRLSVQIGCDTPRNETKPS
jgi:hypothetical protein